MKIAAVNALVLSLACGGSPAFSQAYQSPAAQSYQQRMNQTRANWPGYVQGNNGYGYPIGQTPYQTQPGYGYYGANPYAPGYPVYGGAYGLGAPAPVAGGYFQFGAGAGRGAFYWRSPSGYYYPWGGVTYGAASPVVVVQQGESRPAQPSISEMFKDMRAFLDEQNNKGKFLAEDYAHLSRRLKDLIQKESMFASRGGGALDPVDEEIIRKDLSMLSGDIARRVKP